MPARNKKGGSNNVKKTYPKPTSEKGCTNCERRRIRCDLQQPACHKCYKKGLACPGYNRPLRWVNGVAARGHLRGRSAPVRDSPPFSSLVPASLERLRDEESTTRQQPLSEGEKGAEEPEQVPGPAASGADDPVASTARFMDYYTQNLAGLMVWLDSDENDYRRRVVPLAEQQPAIAFAIMAFAAQHGATAHPHENVATVTEMARDKCLQLIHHRAQVMTNKVMQGHDLNNHSDMADAEWMLASVLIITNFENARCRPEVADGHKRAARTIVNLFSHSVSCQGRELFAFLRNQLAIDDILAATTSFDPCLVKTAITPGSGSDSFVFSNFLSFLHKVTLQSLEPVEVGPGVLPESHRLSLSTVQAEFEQARGVTLMAAGRLGLCGSKMTRDFIRLVEAYHNAGLLYSYRCLRLADEGSVEWTTAANKLFGQLASFEDETIFIQNLPWPTFIAGTCCHGNHERQDRVLTLFNRIYQATKFNNHLGAVDFLETFWADDCSNTDWRPLARKREASGQRVLAV